MRPVTLILLAFALTALAAAPARAHTQTRDKAVLMVHGLDASGDAGVNCDSTFEQLYTALRSYGYNTWIDGLGYYTGDTDCTQTINRAGDHLLGHYGGEDGHVGTGHDADASIRHLAYHFAWYVSHHYSRYGRPVDVVAHSMGGLIVRYALAMQGQPNFPSRLLIEDVVTFGSPHDGTPAGTLCPAATQCREMVSGSGFLDWLAAHAQNPQGYGGTQWTVVGSSSDDWVSEHSATAMRVAHRIRYHAGIGHSQYLQDRGTVHNSAAEFSHNLAPFVYDPTFPWPVRFSDYALYLDEW